jgi:hypothetical protein
MDKDELARAAAEAGLENFLALDAEALGRAYTAALGYRERRAVVGPLEAEPAHVFTPSRDVRS